MSDSPIRIDHDDRHDSLRLIPWWDQTRLAAARVLVVGAGALGNEALKNLALMGVGHIAVVDMDHVESSNLSRSVLYRAVDAGQLKATVAARRVAEIDPAIKITALPFNVIHQVGLGWFADADVVLGCLDNREARLWVNRCCWHVGTPWIDAGIQEISGVVQVFQPPDGTCYECGMKEADYRLINLRYSCPLLRAEDIRQGRVPTTPTIASIIAGWQVQEALKLLHGLPASESSAMVFHGMTNHVYRTQLPRREACLSHDSWEPPIDLPTVSVTDSLEKLLAEAGKIAQQPAQAVRLQRDLITALRCEPCQVDQALCQLRAMTASSQASCPNCQQTMSPEIVGRIDCQHSELLTKSLQQLGIPPADIVTIEFEQGAVPFRLAGTTYGEPA
ncbi:HesA/MoeB/ThiF family protein [Planctomycetaceae bacterium SH139]